MRCSLLWLVAACMHAPPDHGVVHTTESAPESFFDIPGLTQTTKSGHLDNGWGTTHFSNLLVHRAGRVVCAIPIGASGIGEYGWSENEAHLGLSSQQPLRFHVNRSHDSQRDGHRTTCTGYELPSNGECRVVFDRPCSHEVCTPNVTTSSTPGLGTLRGHITRAHEPVVAAHVLVGSYPTMSDEHASFAVEAGAGEHVLEVSGAVPDVQRTTVSIGPNADVDVTIDIRCSKVADTSCCNF